MIDILDSISIAPTAAPQAPAPQAAGITPEALRAAAAQFKTKGNTAKADVCLDMAAKLDRFGSFVSDKQAGFAKSLIVWSIETTAQAPAAPVKAPALPPPTYPTLVAAFGPGRLAKLDLGRLVLSLKNDGSAIWVKFDNRIVGRLDTASNVCALWPSKFLESDSATIIGTWLNELERDPQEAAKDYGRLTGKCCVCSRMLTDPVSIEAGIGPICSGRF